MFYALITSIIFVIVIKYIYLNMKNQPINVDELGNSSWTLLHTLASKYPHQPSKEEQIKMIQFLEGMSKFYPCDKCANHMRKYIFNQKPNVNSRYALQKWLCEFHNSINKRLEKDIFDCNKVQERWSENESCSPQKCSI